MHRPAKTAQMTTPFRLLIPTTEKSLGVNVKTFAEQSDVMMCNCATYGGTETTTNGVLTVEETATITTWFRPDIKSDCRIKRLTDNAVFEVVGEPENIEMRNMFLVFKVRRIKGGA